MIGLNPLDDRGKSTSSTKPMAGLMRIVSIEAESAVPAGFVDRRELIEAAAAKLEVLRTRGSSN